MSIFAREAPRYWARRLSVIPAEPATKQPARGLKEWTGYCDNLPNPETRARWLEQYPDHGIALCLGTRINSTHRIGAVDIDNDAYMRSIIAVLGGCPAAKRGKKGLTVFVRVKFKSVKSTQFKDASGRVAVDLLMSGRMTIQPPSIHPETGRPYQIVGSDIADTKFEDLPELDEQRVRLIRIIVTSVEAQVLASGLGTHDAGLKLTGALVRAGAPDELIEKIISALLPDGYSGNSLGELPEWIKSARDKGFDKPAPKRREKRLSQSDELIRMFNESGALLFHDEGSRGYMTVQLESGGYRHIPLRSSEGGLWLSKMYFDVAKRALTAHAQETAINALEAQALFSAPLRRTFQRIGRHDDSIVVDLGNQDGQLVTISPSGWHLGYRKDVKMIRSPGFRELPVPRREEALTRLQSLLGLDDQAWKLVLAFLLGCLRPEGPYMCLLIEGEQGSGKSFLASVIKHVVDPNQVERSRLPDNDRDLMIHAQDFYLLVFDNVSGMKGDMSDALCMLSTGSAVAVRRLYTNGDLAIFKYVRPFVINGIADFVQRPDLLERAIVLKLPTMTAAIRKTEAEMMGEIQQILPAVLGTLYTIAAAGLRDLPHVSSRGMLRMADAERWISATEAAAGQSPGALVAAIKTAQDEVSIDRAHSDPIVMRLQDVLNQGPIESTVLELFNRLVVGYEGFDRQTPRTPAHLSKHLTRMKPAMLKAGIHFEIREKTRKGRIVRCWLHGDENKPVQIAPPEF